MLLKTQILTKLAVLLGSAMLLAGCNRGLPPEPTAIPTITPTGTATGTPTPRLTATLIPSLTPTITLTPAPTVTLAATNTLPPPTATPVPAIGLPPTAITDDQRTVRFVLSGVQINAALAERFDAAPIPDHRLAPRAVLAEGHLTLFMQIIPSGAGVGTPPQTVTLRLELAAPGGFLETVPTLLAPMGDGVTTQQIKPAEALLLETLLDLARRTTGSVQILFAEYEIRPDGIAFSVIKLG